MKFLYKYYLMIAIPLLCCLSIIGTTLSFQMYNYSVSDKHDSLKRIATDVSYLVEELYYNHTFSREQLVRTLLSSMTNDDRTHIVICDSNGQIFLTSDEYGSNYIGTNISKSILDKTRTNDTFSAVGSLDGLYHGENYTVGTVTRNDRLEPVAYVYVTTSIHNIKRLMTYFTNIFFFLSLALFIIIAVASYLIVRHMTKPLKQISAAASKFARGDFSTRVPVQSNDEIGELTTAFNNMADSLEKSEVLRRSFVANVSHELRSPMTSINGFIDGILDGTIPKEKEAYYLQIVSDEVHRLSRLVSRMLDITVLQETDITVQSTTFDFCELIKRVAISLEQRISEKRISLNIEIPSKETLAYANEDSIYQVIYNLLDNAIKFSDAGSAISIQSFERGDNITFSVANLGHDIPPDQLKHVFDRFHKADKSRSKDKSGLGLGLYIAKTIIHQHKGKIWAESHDGCTKFSFTIPSRTKK